MQATTPTSPLPPPTSLTTVQAALTIELPTQSDEDEAIDRGGWGFIAGVALFVAGAALTKSFSKGAAYTFAFIVGGVLLLALRRVNKRIEEARQRRLEQWDVGEKICVGSDGLALLDDEQKVFVPLESLRAATSTDRALHLQLGSETYDVALGSEELATTIAGRINDARKRRAELERELEEIDLAGYDLLDREGGARACAERVAESLRQDTNYRHLSPPLEQLLAMLCNPLTTCRVRVCIGVALARTDPERYRVAIEQTANTTANAPLRDALRAAAEGKLDEIALEMAERWRRGDR